MPRLHSYSSLSLKGPGQSFSKKQKQNFEYVKVGYPGNFTQNRSAFSPDHSITVIVGRNFVGTTTDGRQIVPRKIDGLATHSGSFSDVTYGSGVGFLAVGYTDSGPPARGLMAFSSNGIDWVSRTPPVTTNLIGCTYANGIFVICGSFGNIWTSTDTITWTKSDTGNTTSQIWSIAWNGTRWHTSGDLLLTSTSPTAASGTWTVVSDAAAPSNCWKIVASPTTNRFVAAGNSGRICVSNPAGTVWTAYTVPLTTSTYSGIEFATINSVEYAIIVGGNSSSQGSIAFSTATSSFGTWSSVSNVAESPLGGIVWNGADFLATGGQNNIIASTNTASWTASSTTWTFRSRGLDINSVDYSPSLGLYAAVGKYSPASDLGGIFISSDGYTWTRTQGATGVRNEIRWLEDGYFYVVGNAGFSFLRSNNGNSWSVLPQVGGSGQNLRSIAYGDGWYVIVGDGGKIFYSSTPTVSASWKTATLENTPGGNINSVVFNKLTKEWFAVGNGGIARVSFAGLRGTFSATDTNYGTSPLFNKISTDGTTIAISIFWYKNPGFTQEGRVFLYRVSDLGLIRSIISPTAGETTFGSAVAVSGNYVGVTASGGAGKAYIFNLDGTLHQTLLAPAGFSGAWGHKIRIDGDYCVIADCYWVSSNRQNGRVHIYKVSDGTLWSTITNPSISGTNNIRFGWDISLSGNILLVGTNFGARAYKYNVTSSTPLAIVITEPFGTLSSTFGSAVAIAGTRMLIADPYGGSTREGSTLGSGVVHVFNLLDDTLITTIENPNAVGPEFRDYFGNFMWGSSDYIAIGTACEDSMFGYSNSGVVYIYNTTDLNLVRTMMNPNKDGDSNDAFGGASWDPSVEDNPGGFNTPIVVSGSNLLAASPVEQRLYVYNLSEGPAYWFTVNTGTFDNLISVDFTNNINNLHQARYVAVGSSGRWVHWYRYRHGSTTSSVGSSLTLNEIRWDPNRERFIAVGSNQSIYEMPNYTSIFDIQWEQQEISNQLSLTTTDGEFRSVAFSREKNQYIVGGVNDIVLTREMYDEYQIGEFVAGGYYAGNIIVNNIAYALILAPKNGGESTIPLSIQSSRASEWPDGTLTLNNGDQASAALADVGLSGAASFCRNLILNGYNDWYLPSRDELEICYRAFKPTTDNNNTSSRGITPAEFSEGYTGTSRNGLNANSRPAGFSYSTTQPAQTTVALFREGGSEAFNSAAGYWSSSRLSSAITEQGVGQIFSTGQQFSTFKDLNFRVRAVRKQQLPLLKEIKQTYKFTEYTFTPGVSIRYTEYDSFNNRVICVGANRLHYTSDGISWTEGTYPDTARPALFFKRLSDGFYYVGHIYGGLYRSATGIDSWSQLTVPTTANTHIYDIVFENSQYIFSTSTGIYTTSSVTSPTFTQRLTTTTYCRRIAKNPNTGRLAVVAANIGELTPRGLLYTSDDFGVTWTLRYTYDSYWPSRITDLIWSGTAFVGTGFEENTGNTEIRRGVVFNFGADGIVANIVYDSEAREGNINYEAPAMHSIAKNTETITDLIAVGDYGRIVTSTDNGATWTRQVTTSSYNLGAAVYMPNISKFIIFSKRNNQYILAEPPIKPDPVFSTKNQRTAPFSPGTVRTAFDAVNNRLISVGDNGIYYSSDGVTWTQGTYAATGTQSIFCIQLSDGYFYAGHLTGILRYSSTGIDSYINWPVPVSNQALRDIIMSASNYVVACGGIWTASSRGGAWVQRSTVDAFSFARNPNTGRLIAVSAVPNSGAIRIYASDNNGITWTELQTLTPTGSDSSSFTVFAQINWYKSGNVFIVTHGWSRSGSNGAIWRLNSEGISLNGTPSTTTTSFLTGFGAVNNDAFVVGFSGKIFRTVNKGINWTDITEIVLTNLGSVTYMPNVKRLVFGGYMMDSYFTSDGAG